MEKGKIVTFSIIVLILFVAGGIIYFKNFQGATVDTAGEKESKWIGEHSILYIQPGCIHCKEQEDKFGTNIKYLNVVDCLKEPQKCIDAGIEGTPTWIINGEKYIGATSIETLKELTDYQD